MLVRLGMSLNVLIVFFTPSVSGGAELPSLDRFGDLLPDGAVARLGSLRLRPERSIVSGAFSPDGKLLATASTKGDIVFWDTATGKETRRLRVSVPGRLNGLRLSGDGKSLILVGDAGFFRIVDAVRGAQLRKLDPPGNERLEALEVSRDGKIAAILHFSGKIHIWDLAGGKQLQVFEGLKDNRLWQNAPGQLIALTPDSKQLALPHSDGSLHLLDVASGKEIRAVEMPPLPKARPGRQAMRPPQKVAISPDGRYLAYANHQTAIALCDLKTGKRLHQLGQLVAGITGLAFAPNSRFLAVCGPAYVRVFGVVSGKEIRRFPKPSGTRGTVAFAPDGRTLAALGGGCLVPLWDVYADRSVSAVVGHQSPIQELAFFPDGKRLVSAGQADGLMVWDIAAGRDIGHHRSAFSFSSRFTISDDGARLQYAGLDRVLHRWDPANGDEERQPLPGLWASFTASPDGRTLAGISSSHPPQLGLYDLRDTKKAGRMLALPATARGSPRTMFSPDSRWFAAAASDGDLRLWDRNTGQLVVECKAGKASRPIAYYSFAADGRSLALFDGDLRIHEIPGGGERLHLPASVGVSALTYSADGRFLACGHSDGSILVYGAATGKQLVKWQGRQGAIYALAFDGAGRRLASGGENGAILVWKLSKDENLPASLTAEQAAALWQTLIGDDAAAAHRALAGLAAAPAEALPLLKERFPTLAKPPTAERLARLIAELDDDSFQIREQATHELAEAGRDAANALQTALANKPSLERRLRIKTLLESLSNRVDRKRLHCQRVVEVLERIGTPQAKALLRDFAKQPLSDELREEVQASLRRMIDKPRLDP